MTPRYAHRFLPDKFAYARWENIFLGKQLKSLCETKKRLCIDKIGNKHSKCTWITCHCLIEARKSSDETMFYLHTQTHTHPVLSGKAQENNSKISLHKAMPFLLSLRRSSPEWLRNMNEFGYREQRGWKGILKSIVRQGVAISFLKESYINYVEIARHNINYESRLRVDFRNDPNNFWNEIIHEHSPPST